MAELLVIRHGQASFGAENYDRLSDLGHRQSALAGEALRASGWHPDRVITGGLLRQKQTLRAMGHEGAAQEHRGFDEYDFHDLLRARFGGDVPVDVMQDRKMHFRTLKETVLEWQNGGLPGARESWAAFSARVDAARCFATDTAAQRVLVVSSGGVIGQLVASSLGAPAARMIQLNLQVKNTAITRFIFTERAFFLHEFNSLPHLMDAARAQFLTYS